MNVRSPLCSAHSEHAGRQARASVSMHVAEHGSMAKHAMFIAHTYELTCKGMPMMPHAHMPHALTQNEGLQLRWREFCYIKGSSCLMYTL